MIYDYSVTKANGEQLNLSEYKGKVILVVNTATGRGFTPQYAPIEQLYRDYHEQGLKSLIFPATSSAARLRAAMKRSMNSARCTITRLSRR